jgi:hypothetical protein
LTASALAAGKPPLIATNRDVLTVSRSEATVADESRYVCRPLEMVL